MDATNAPETYSIIYRDASSKVPTRSLLETDRYDQAVATLEIVVLTPGVELIDYSDNLNGSIDYLLAFGQVEETYDGVAV